MEQLWVNGVYGWIQNELSTLDDKEEWRPQGMAILYIEKELKNTKIDDYDLIMMEISTLFLDEFILLLLDSDELPIISFPCDRGYSSTDIFFHVIVH